MIRLNHVTILGQFILQTFIIYQAYTKIIDLNSELFFKLSPKIRSENFFNSIAKIIKIVIIQAKLITKFLKINI